jgi:hypothetical protein
LLDAAHVDIDAVAAPAAKAYLVERIVDPARWQPVPEDFKSSETVVTL